MHFEWLLDQEQQGQFKIYWKPGKTNLAHYFTKHHPPSHHRHMRGEFLTRVAELQRLRKLPKEVSLAMTDGIFSTFLCKGVLIHTYGDQRYMENGIKYSLANI